MKRFDAHPEEALELEKLGLLNGSEQAALHTHLRECGACRAELWAHRHTPFRATPPTASDAALDRAAVAAALSVLNRRAALRARWRRAWPLVLGFALPVAVLAAAGIWRLRRPAVVVKTVSVAQALSTATPAPSAPALSAPAPAPVAVPDLPSPSPAPSAESATAADLFRRAGDLKRAGQSARAVNVYRQLQGRFASSAEAKLSYVIAGGLLLEQGKAAYAVAQFDRYLATSGPASEEALLGRAHALQRLGRPQEEALAWQQLLARSPASVHAQGARARLVQLNAAAATPEHP